MIVAIPLGTKIAVKLRHDEKEPKISFSKSVERRNLKLRKNLMQEIKYLGNMQR